MVVVGGKHIVTVAQKAKVRQKSIVTMMIEIGGSSSGPPATPPRSASLISTRPAGCAGNISISVALKLARYSTSFQARITSGVDISFLLLFGFAFSLIRPFPRE